MFKTLVIASSVAVFGVAAVIAEARPPMDHTREQMAVEREAVEMVAQVEAVARDVRYLPGAWQA